MHSVIEMGLDTQVGWVLKLNGPVIFDDHVLGCSLLQELSVIRTSIGEDVVVWSPSISGNFNVAEAMRLLVIADNANSPDWKNLIWNNRFPSKISIFHWLDCNRSIPVKDTLIRRHIISAHSSSFCVWCNSEPETVDHLLIHCSWS
ncbi:uncharacterized protein [Rutidosis leptorrhynchoides]|uniref:uncharacterized protein n=1 Tax=Rutidosis leptorrhynchoides TaxID=125765 RepID=UPI003A9A396A